MILEKHRYTVGTFTTRQEAEQAFAKLYCAGLPIGHISVVTKDSELLAELRAAIAKTQAVAIETEHIEKSPCATIVGSTVGAIGGCLAGLGALLIPGVAPTLVVGTVGTALTATLFGSGIGLVFGGLISTCNANRQVVAESIEGDRAFPQEYLVIVDGTDAEASRAERILKTVSGR